MRIQSIKILFLITAVFCYPLIFTQGIVGNFGDIYQYAAPFRHFAASSLQSGIIPLWNPFIFAGAPFQASPQSALFYPLSTFFYFIPLNYAFNIFSVLHTFLNALGMFLFLRTIHRSQSASLWGSLIWSFSFFFLSKYAAGHVIHLSGYAWTPYILTFFIQIIVNKEPIMGLCFLGLLISSLLQFFSGHIQVWLLSHFLLSVIFIWKFVGDFKKYNNFYINLSATFLICFILLSLVQSFPTLLYMTLSSRYNAYDTFTEQSVYNFATSYSMSWNCLIGLFFPNFFGTPMHNNYVHPDSPSLYFETNAIYMGFVPIFFAIAGLISLFKNKKFFLPLLSLLFLFLAAGKYSPIYNLFWKLFNFMRVPARFYFITFLGLVLMASVFWDKLLKNRSKFVKIAFFLITLTDLFLNGKQFLWSEDYKAKIGRSAIIQWLQSQTEQTKKFYVYPQFRIFTSGEVGNPNKPMFFQLLNVNGYEAIVQKSLLRYFAFTQGNESLLTTGVNLINPIKPSFLLMGVQYLISSTRLKLNWPVKYENGQLTIYENPNIFFPVQAIFSAKKAANYETVFSIINSPNFRPNQEIVQLADSSWNQKKLDIIEENLPKKEVQLYYYYRIHPNRIEMVWKGNEPSRFWIFLSEAFYPGWEAWSELGHRWIPFESNGYFQSILFSQQKIPREKIYWLFRPKDFQLGAWISLLSIIALFSGSMIGMIKLIRKEKYHLI